MIAIARQHNVDPVKLAHYLDAFIKYHEKTHATTTLSAFHSAEQRGYLIFIDDLPSVYDEYLADKYALKRTLFLIARDESDALNFGQYSTAVLEAAVLFRGSATDTGAHMACASAVLEELTVLDTNIDSQKIILAQYQKQILDQSLSVDIKKWNNNVSTMKIKLTPSFIRWLFPSDNNPSSYEKSFLEKADQDRKKILAYYDENIATYLKDNLNLQLRHVTAFNHLLPDHLRENKITEALNLFEALRWTDEKLLFSSPS